MTLRLADKQFEASFYVRTSPGFRCVSSIIGAQGVFFLCPCGGHTLCIPFRNPREARVEPVSPSWEMTGTGLEDLTLSPSINVGGSVNDPCWHGFIQNGEVVTCQ